MKEDMLSLESLGLIIVGTGGFILLHSSQCQPKNTTSVVIANLLSLTLTTLAFWATGFAFAFGDNTNNYSNFFLSFTRFLLIRANPSDYQLFTQEVVLVNLAIVFINAGFISRLRLWLYPLVAIVTAGFLYPCSRHWTDHTEGWLKSGVDVDGKNIAYRDIYGAGSIHVFSGAAALISTVLLGPRKDRRGKSFGPVGGNIVPLILLGGTLAIVGMMAKNQAFEPTNSYSLTLINNILSAQASALVSYALKTTNFFGDRSGTKALINGAIAGLVGMSCKSDYHPYGGFVIGIVSGLSYVSWSSLLQVCHVDDPTDSIAVHLGAGLWALLAAPLFSKSTGIFYNPEKEAFKVFGWHLLGGVAIFVWSGLTFFLLLIVYVCAKVIGYSSQEAVDAGLDAYVHKEPAYPDRDQYTQETGPTRVMNDILLGKYNSGASYRVNGSYENNQNKDLVQPVTLDTRNEQHSRDVRY